jgi:peptide/nickel transport system permease protein
VPVHIQYFRWLGDILFRGDLGDSIWKKTPVLELLRQRWPVTLQLGLMGLIVAQLIALPIGILSAVRQDTLTDYAARSLAILFIAIPGFWLGTMIIVFPSIWWRLAPPAIWVPFANDPIASIKMTILPAIVLGMSMSGMTMRLTRTMMLEVLRQDYIRTAWSKGLKERLVVWRHALKNALIPVITLIGIQLPVLVGGSVIVEEIFSLPGVGRLLLTAIIDRDYAIVSGTMLIIGWFIVVANLAVDLLYAVMDPRISYK